MKNIRLSDRGASIILRILSVVSGDINRLGSNKQANIRREASRMLKKLILGINTITNEK